jgi:hypothetical protein
MLWDRARLSRWFYRFTAVHFVITSLTGVVLYFRPGNGRPGWYSDNAKEWLVMIHNGEWLSYTLFGRSVFSGLLIGSVLAMALIGFSTKGMRRQLGGARLRHAWVALIALFTACNGSNELSQLKNPDSGAASCTQCTTTSECGSGESCAQFGGDSFCVKDCNPGMCASGEACVPLSTQEGQQAEVCVSTVHPCGDPNMQPTGSDGGAPGSDATTSNACGSLIPPDMAAGCNSCSSGRHTCAANGCYGGWYCNSDTNRCQAAPGSCGGSTDGGVPIPDGGFSFPDASNLPPGAIGPNGGTIPQLTFAIVGDTRPPSPDDTRAYPTTVISKIWQDVQAENPRPAFAVTTGDYMFAYASGGEATPQLAAYAQARSAFENIVFPAMGNHECTGATNSNCGEGGTHSNNYDAFLAHVLQPIGKSDPYYSVNINAMDGSWSAKFVFVAANAWGPTQDSWLRTTMAQQTTYTFVLRHERSSVTEAPGVSPSNQIIAQFPYTMLIVGHTHTYQRLSTREVVVGNGGAPLTSGTNYGYVTVQQRTDGAIQFVSKDYQSGAVIDSFAVTPNGMPAP